MLFMPGLKKHRAMARRMIGFVDVVATTFLPRVEFPVDCTVDAHFVKFKNHLHKKVPRKISSLFRGIERLVHAMIHIKVDQETMKPRIF